MFTVLTRCACELVAVVVVIAATVGVAAAAAACLAASLTHSELHIEVFSVFIVRECVIYYFKLK